MSMPPNHSGRLIETVMGESTIEWRDRGLVALPEAPVHYQRKEAGNKVNKDDDEVDSFDLFLIDRSHHIAKSRLGATDSNQISRFEDHKEGKPHDRTNKKDDRNGLTGRVIHQ